VHEWTFLRWQFVRANGTAALFAEKERLQRALSSGHDGEDLQDNAEDDNAPTLADPGAPEHRDSGYAYVFYTTSDPYACSVLVNMRRLQELGASYPIYVLADHAQPRSPIYWLAGRRCRRDASLLAQEGLSGQYFHVD
jgi:hypothetical protein